MRVGNVGETQGKGFCKFAVERWANDGEMAKIINSITSSNIKFLGISCDMVFAADNKKD